MTKSNLTLIALNFAEKVATLDVSQDNQIYKMHDVSDLLSQQCLYLSRIS